MNWEYDGDKGPSHWGNLDRSFICCHSGKNQSPIDIRTSVKKSLPKIEFFYTPVQINIIWANHTYQANFEPGSYLILEGIQFNLVQLHFHIPGEHTINGKQYAAELHIVHKSVDEKLAVISVLLEEGNQNFSLAPFIDSLPTQQGDTKSARVKINAENLLPAIKTTYRYNGSLTTPPCTEGVSWLVMTHTVQASAQQLIALKGVEGSNNRPVQPLNGRVVVEDNPNMDF